jgi:excisionase family DNA binding protein
MSLDDLQLLTVDEVAGLLLVHRNMVYKLVSDEKLMAVRNGRKIAFTRRQVADYIDAQSKPVARTSVQSATVTRRRRNV